MEVAKTTTTTTQRRSPRLKIGSVSIRKMTTRSFSNDSLHFISFSFCRHAVLAVDIAVDTAGGQGWRPSPTSGRLWRQSQKWWLWWSPCFAIHKTNKSSLDHDGDLKSPPRLGGHGDKIGAGVSHRTTRKVYIFQRQR